MLGEKPITTAMFLLDFFNWRRRVMKKIIVVVLVLLLTGCGDLFEQPPSYGAVTECTNDILLGEGTEQDPYQINNSQDL